MFELTMRASPEGSYLAAISRPRIERGWSFPAARPRTSRQGDAYGHHQGGPDGRHPDDRIRHFIFANLNGTISAWDAGTVATVEATTPGASYTGLAIASNTAGSFLYAANDPATPTRSTSPRASTARRTGYSARCIWSRTSTTAGRPEERLRDRRQPPRDLRQPGKPGVRRPGLPAHPRQQGQRRDDLERLAVARRPLGPDRQRPGEHGPGVRLQRPERRGDPDRLVDPQGRRSEGREHDGDHQQPRRVDLPDGRQGIRR